MGNGSGGASSSSMPPSQVTSPTGAPSNGGSMPHNLPAVLKDRAPPASSLGKMSQLGSSRGPPPPVPPRSPKRINSPAVPASVAPSTKGETTQKPGRRQSPSAPPL
jgi:hypothetical protein